LKTKLGADDSQRLERHLDAFRELEIQIGISLPTDARPGASCPASSNAATLLGAKATDSANLPVVGKQQMDLAVQALACDVSRVVLLQWTNTNSRQTYPWLGISGDHHGLSHGTGEAATRAKLTSIYTWYASQYAYFLRKLAAVPEGNGTLLDNTVVLWISEFGDGNSHGMTNIPCLVGGNAGGVLKQGNFLSLGGRSHNDVLLTMLAAVGQPIAAFGSQKYSGGVITEMFNT